MTAYEGYYPVARRHGNSTLPTTPYPPRVIMPAWPQAAVYHDGEDRQPTAAQAEDWAAYAPYPAEQQEDVEQSRKRRVFQPYGRQHLFPPAAVKNQGNGRGPPHRPVQARPDESAMPDPNPYWEAMNAYGYSPRRRPAVLPAPGPPAYAHRLHYPLLAPAPADHPAPPRDNEDNEQGPPQDDATNHAQRHVLSGPSFYGVGDRETNVKAKKYDDDRVEYY